MGKRYEVILKGARAVDPANDLDRIADVAIAGGRIAAVAPDLAAADAAEVVDLRGKLVTPGLIDVHAHIFEHVNGPFGLDADDVGVRSGVTTVVEQGGVSYATMPAFRRFVVEQKATRVLAFSSVFLGGGIGGFGFPEQFRPDLIIVKDAIQCAKDNPDILRGWKLHAEGRGHSLWGTQLLEKAVEIADATSLPIYVHLGQMWRPNSPEEDTVENEAILGQLLKGLRRGDAITHCFSAERGTYTAGGSMHPLYGQALERGILTDVGHGLGFNFDLARVGFAAGLVPDTASSDLHGWNARRHDDTASRFNPDRYPPFAPRHSLAWVMNALLAVGYTLQQVVAMVTSNAAEMVGMSGEIGTLAPGTGADVTVFDEREGAWLMKDFKGGEAVTTRWLAPVFCLRGGRRFDCAASHLPVPEPWPGPAAAG